jgi:hypothetical protein
MLIETAFSQLLSLVLGASTVDLANPKLKEALMICSQTDIKSDNLPLLVDSCTLTCPVFAIGFVLSRDCVSPWVSTYTMLSFWEHSSV